MDNHDKQQNLHYKDDDIDLDAAWIHFYSNELIPVWMTCRRFKQEWRTLDIDVERFIKEES